MTEIKTYEWFKENNYGRKCIIDNDDREDPKTDIKKLAEACKSEGGLVGARMAIQYIQSHPHCKGSNVKLCNYLRVEY